MNKCVYVIADVYLDYYRYEMATSKKRKTLSTSTGKKASMSTSKGVGTSRTSAPAPLQPYDQNKCVY